MTCAAAQLTSGYMATYIYSTIPTLGLDHSSRCHSQTYLNPKPLQPEVQITEIRLILLTETVVSREPVVVDTRCSVHRMTGRPRPMKPTLGGGRQRIPVNAATLRIRDTL